MEYFSEPFHINLLKNHILKDPLLDWFAIQSINNNYQEDKNTYYKDYILKESKEYKNSVINKVLRKIKQFSNESVQKNPTIHQTIDLIKNNSPLITSAKLPFQKMIVHCDIVIRFDYFRSIFPEIKNIPFHLLCNDHEYVLINISYSSIHFKMDLKECMNEGILLYKKCCLYAFQYAFSKVSTYHPKCLILGKEYYYKKTLLPKKEFIGFVTIDEKIKDKFYKAYDWILLLKEKYKEMKVLPSPSHKELYPNMNYKDSQWENEKYKLAEKIKEITLVWNISYEQRCEYLKKGIVCWDDPRLLNQLKESKKKEIQERMIHMNQQEDILIYPRKNISKEFQEILSKNEADIVFDVESFLSFDNKVIKDNEKTPVLAILGFIHKGTFYDYTIGNYSITDEKKMVVDFCNHLWKINKQSKNTINIYHWGHAEHNYFNYIHKRYPTLSFPEYKLIDVLDYFRMEPIIVQGIFKFGLKSIGKALYKNHLIKTTWDEQNDNGLDAMIVFKEICKNHTKNIPIKRYLEISSIIDYNKIDCQVLSEIIDLLRENYKKC